ncbi:MAG: uroporphyrinogen-III C-methyltransferase [Nitrospiria bacterium]
MTPSKNIGKVYLVGAGPGDPKLITLRGKELLEEADTIIYDYLANEKLLGFAKEAAEKIYVGKKGGSKSSEHQKKINDLMIQRAHTGREVVRLKGGDPFIFGRGGEEIEALAAASIPFEVIPGIPSAIAVPAYAGISLTHREMSSSVILITGHENPEKEKKHLNWEKLATGGDTLVFMMAMGNLPGIIQKLLHHGRHPETPVALIRWGTYPYQKTLTGTLNDIVKKVSETGLKPPVVMVVGAVVSLRKDFNWYESRPLFGKRILVTRAQAQATEFLDLLERNGAEAISFPTIKIVPPPSWAQFDAAIDQIETYDVLIFTSVNGVSFFRKRLKTLQKDIRLLKGLLLCAIGPRTEKSIKDWGLQVDITAAEFKAEGLLKALKQYGFFENNKKKGNRAKRFLIPRAQEAREILPDEIRRQGGVVDVVPTYQAIRPAYSEEALESLFCKKKIDMLTFASSSTLRNFVEIVGKERMKTWFCESAIACIGPITAGTAQKHGLEVDVLPAEYTFSSLADEIIDYYQQKQ